jgi:hypothetical protein
MFRLLKIAALIVVVIFIAAYLLYWVNAKVGFFVLTDHCEGHVLYKGSFSEDVLRLDCAERGGTFNACGPRCRNGMVIPVAVCGSYACDL